MAVLQPLVFGFSDRQLDIIKTAAEQVPQQWRSRYLEAVSCRLLKADEFSDAVVIDAVAGVLAQLVPSPD